MGTSVTPSPTQGADPQGVPNLPRILSPDEFNQARMLSPTQLSQAKFPVLPPPYVPKDAVKTLDPNTPTDKGTQMPGLAGILMRQVVSPLAAHPGLAAGLAAAQVTPVAPAVDYTMMGMMGKDILDYSAQKAAEQTLPPDIKAQAEKDPDRISGEQAAVEAASMGLVPAMKGAAKGIGKVADKALQAASAPMREKVTAHVDAISDAFNKIFAPASRTPESKGMADIMRATTGEQAMAYEQASFQLDQFRRAIDPLPDADKLGFIDVVEGGKAQASPEFQKAADTMRKIGDETWNHIVSLRPDAADSYIQDYFPHRWKDPEMAKVVFGADKAPVPTAETGPDIPRPRTASGRLKNLGSATTEELANEYALSKGDLDLAPKLEAELTQRGLAPDDALAHGQAAVDAQNAKVGAPTSTDDALVKAQRQTGSKRPMEGSKNFLKQRTIPTTADGIALGLEPVSTNPVDLFLLDLRNKQKFIMAHETLTQGKDAGFIKFFSGALDDGYKPIDDKVATVFGPRHPDTGMNTIAGRYAAPEPVATIINNYLSPGLRGNAIYDAYRGLGNTLNQAQLGLSAFHLGMTSIDATVSRAALGLEYLHTALKTGDPDAAMMGMKKLATAPGAPFAAIAQGLVGDPLNAKFGTNIQLGMGAKVRAAYLNPESATPEFQALANAMKEAGGRARMDSFYANSSPEKFMAALHEHDPVGMAKMALPAFFETASKPIMEHIVPLQKMQVFGEMAQKVLGDLPPEATLAERRAALASAWDSVDNRMGQLVYDNLFWNKTFKDLAMGSVRSVGWNIGTIREVAGGALDVPKLLHGELTHSAAYAITLPIVVGMYGATYQYLRTGKGPEELKDYYFPKTGEQDADGNDERVQLPTYMKDVFAYTRHPGQTLVNKLGPLPEAIAEQYRNQNFFGDQIRNPDDPLVKQLTQEAEWMGKTIEPFAFTNMGEQAKRSDVGTASKLGNWFGVTPAHREDVRTTAQNDMAAMAVKRGHAELTPEEQDAAGQRRDILAGLRRNGNIDFNQAVNQALQSGGIVPADLGKLMKRAGLTPAQERFKSLSTAQALKIFQEATPKEQGMFAELLAKKIESAEKRGSGL